MPVGAAFPSRRELTEPAPFSNLDPWPSHVAEPIGEVGMSEVAAGRYGASRGSRGGGKVWFSGQSRTSRIGTESESSADSGPSRRGKGAYNLGESIVVGNEEVQTANVSLASV